MEHDEILTQCLLNPDAIVSYIEALESQNKAKDARIEALESQVIELQEQINELESLLNCIKGKKKRPSNGTFS